MYKTITEQSVFIFMQFAIIDVTLIVDDYIWCVAMCL